MNIIENRNKNGELISFRIRVSDGVGVDGRQRFKNMTWKVPRGMTEKQAQKAAQTVAIEFEEQVRNGLAGSQRGLKLAEFAPLYLDIKKDVLSPRTYETYTHVINTLIIPLLGHIRLTDLKPAHAQEFVRRMQELSPVKLSPATVKRKLAILQSMLRQAVKLGLIQNNPADADRLTLPKAVTPKTEIFSRQEAAQMLEYLESEPLQYQTIIWLAIMTGARLGELCALKFSDVDFMNRRITIARSAYKLAGQPVRTKPPKDNDVRTVTVDEVCIDLIRQLKAEKEREQVRLGTAWIGDEWLFTQWDGSIIYPQTPSQWFSEFLARHGMKHRKFHALRHTSATLLLLSGTNVKQVSGRLGHADLRVTNGYLHCLAEADEAAANALSSLLITQRRRPETDAETSRSIQQTG